MKKAILFCSLFTFILFVATSWASTAPSIDTVNALPLSEITSWQTDGNKALSTFELNTDLSLNTHQVAAAQWFFKVQKISSQKIKFTKELRIERDLESTESQLLSSCQSFSWTMNIDISFRAGQYAYKVLSTSVQAPSLQTLSMLEGVTSAKESHSLECSSAQ